jgi:hypothetical protein
MEPIPIALHTRVKIEMLAKNGGRENLELVLVPDAAADFDKGLLGAGTPLAQTLLGHAAGETLDYRRGDITRVKILSVEPAEVTDAGSGGERDEALRRARDKAELANMVSFALTFDSKWGDYDPEQIVKQYEEGEKKENPPDASGTKESGEAPDSQEPKNKPA